MKLWVAGVLSLEAATDLLVDGVQRLEVATGQPAAGG